MAEKFFGVEDIKVIGLTSTKNLIVSGVSTLGEVKNIEVTGLTSTKDLIVSGVSTLGVTTLTDVTAQQLYISGITSVGTGVTINPSPGSIAVSGIITAGGGFIGTIRASDIVGEISGTDITVADESTDTSCNIIFVTEATGSGLGPKSNANLTYNSNAGILSSTKFSGDGSELTNVTGINTGTEIQKDGIVVGSATTIINFAKGILVDPSPNLGIVTVSSSRSAGGGGAGAGAGGKSSYSDYASYSEFSYGARNIVGLETSYCITGILTGSQTSSQNYWIGHQFGNDVRCSSDGNTIVISSSGDGGVSGINTTGLVYVYDRLGPGGKFNETILAASDRLEADYSSSEWELFGSGIACSADGNTIYVGAIRQHNDNPSIYIFDRVNRVGIESYFEEVARIEIGGEPNRMVCSADGNTLFVGHYDTVLSSVNNSNGHTVDVYDRVENQLVGVATIYGQNFSSVYKSQFGYSLACNVDGSSLIVGAPDYSWASPPSNSQMRGAVLVYDREYQVGIGTTFTQVGILSGRDDDNDYEFGWSVACNNDASSIMVGEFEEAIKVLGTPNTDGRSGKTGRVHVFDRKNCVGVGTTFTKVGILTGSASNYLSNQFGESLACSADGNIIFVSDIERKWSSLNEDYYWDNGQVYKFDRQGNDFIETKLIDPGHPYDDELGWSLACSADASTMIVSQIPQNFDDGRALVYDLETKEIPLVRAGIGSTALYIDCKVSIADTTSNAGGAKYISTESPSSGIGTFGDIWYNIGGEGHALANFDITSLPTLP